MHLFGGSGGGGGGASQAKSRWKKAGRLVKMGLSVKNLINTGFEVIDGVGLPVKLVDEALAALESARATMAPAGATKREEEEEKPKLYVTGHSLGAALAKNALTQLLLRDAGDKFASVNAYTFAPPVTGNPEYVITISLSLSFSYDRIIPGDAKY